MQLSNNGFELSWRSEMKLANSMMIKLKFCGIKFWNADICSWLIKTPKSSDSILIKDSNLVLNHFSLYIVMKKSNTLLY